MINECPKLYKNRYMICFYERDDDTLKYSFNNIKEICRQLKWNITRKNLNRIQVDLYRSLRRHNHRTNLFKQSLHVYIIDVTKEED